MRLEAHSHPKRPRREVFLVGVCYFMLYNKIKLLCYYDRLAEAAPRVKLTTPRQQQKIAHLITT